jgi:hypothetical protein
MAKYNLIVKADTIGEAERHVDEHLSIPLASARALGYNQVIVTVEGDPDVLTAKLHEWHRTTRPDEEKRFAPGSLIWWQA